MKRRDFIKLSSAGLVGATTGSILPGNKVYSGNINRATNGPKMNKGFMLGTFPGDNDLSLIQKFGMIRNAGFDGVEPSSGLDRKEVLHARDATGLEIPSVVVSTHWTHPLSSPDPAIRKKGLKGLETAITDAHEYGASCVLLVPGIVSNEVSYTDTYRRSQREIRKVLPLAEEMEVTIAIENVWNHFLLSPMEAARYIDEFQSPYIGWYFDVGNIINYGWAHQWIRILGKRIQMIHIKEYSRQKRDQEGLWKGFNVNYLEGDNNWPEIMRALNDVGYDGYVIAEPPYRDDNVDVDTWLKQYIADRMDKILSM